MARFLPSHRQWLERLRQELAELLGDRVGVIVFRLGYGFPMKSTAVRLPLDRTAFS